MNLATGQVEARYEYGPFGEPLRAEGGPIAQANPLRFATKFVDAETGLSFYGHRYYSAALGRWLSRDPIAESGGLNLYAMVGNDALNGIDVLGLAGNPDQCCENGAALVTDDNGVLCCPEKIKVDPKTKKRTCVVATTNPPKAAGGDDDVPVTFSDPCNETVPGPWTYKEMSCNPRPSNPTENSRTSGGGGSCDGDASSTEIPFELLDWTRLFPESKSSYAGGYARDADGVDAWSGGDESTLNQLYDDFLAARRPDIPTQVMADGLLFAAAALTPFPGDEEAAAAATLAKLAKGAGNASKAKRVPSAILRNRWEKTFGTKWPKDPKTGRNQDACHKKALADGGDNSLDNIEPKPHDIHVQSHIQNGDFRRWGARKK